MKHTPGPWEIGDLDRNGQRIVRSEHIEICTCWHHCVGSIEKEMEANAQLIAAAPDLLAFAEKAVKELNEIRARDGVPYTHAGYKASVCEKYFSSVVDEGFAAISKAEGRI